MEETSRQPFARSNRLCAAADALLVAIHSPRGFNSRISMTVGPTRVGGSLPSTVFTSEELIEAMTMLIRMGLVPLHTTGVRHRAKF